MLLNGTWFLRIRATEIKSLITRWDDYARRTKEHRQLCRTTLTPNVSPCPPIHLICFFMERYQFAGVTSTSYPDVYATMLRWVGSFNLNIAWILSAGCVIQSNFYHGLLISTIGFLVIVGIVLLSTTIRRHICDADSRDALPKIDQAHASVLLWLSLLIYATVSSMIFKTFACDHLDNGRSFLRADHSLECYTATHKAFMAYAGVMVAVYPVGIPACYAFVLYRSRASLTAGQVTNNAEVGIYQELWAPYRPDVYYYEIVECFRRVTLSGAVVFIFPNTAGQVATGVLLAMMFAAVLVVLDPYVSRWHTWLARSSHAVVILSLYLALLQRVDGFSDESSSQHVFAGVLVALNCGLVLAVFFETCGMCSVTVQEIREPTSHAASNTVQTSSTRLCHLRLSAQVAHSAESPPAIQLNSLGGFQSHSSSLREGFVRQSEQRFRWS